MSDKHLSRSTVHEYKIVSVNRFEPIHKSPVPPPEQVKSNTREIIALSSWSDTEKE